MSFSDEYKAGYTGNYNPNVDVFSYSYQMGQNDRERQLRDGSYGSGGATGAAGGGGAVLAALMVIIAACAFFIALASYPVASGLTGIVFAIASTAINSDGASMNGVGLVFALMVPCFIVFLLAFNVEKKLATVRSYQVFRQIWRMIIGTFFIHTLGSMLHMQGSNPGILEYGIDAVATICAPFLMYLNSIRLDRKYQLEPIRWRLIEMLMAPVKDRLVARVDESVRDTPVYHVTDMYANAPMDVQVANGMVKLGNTEVPTGNIKTVRFERERGTLLIAAGVILPVILIAIIGGPDNQYRGFYQQLFGVLSLAGGALLILWGAIPSFPAGRLQGPFRHLSIYFAKTPEESGQVYVKFQRPAEESTFLQAIENGLKAMPRAATATASAPEQRKTGGGWLRRLVPFEF